MRKKLSVTVFIMGLLVMASPLWAGGAIVVGVAPPPLIVEQVPPAPVAGYYLWQPGYWSWTGVRYVWVPGAYVRAPRPGAVWVPGHWLAARHGGWAWVGGYWRR